MKVLILGATGLVGSLLLKKLLSDDSYEQVTSITRKPLGFNHEKLNSLVGDLSDLDKISSETKAFNCDAVFCCLGTTIKAAGSKEAFKRVDFELPIMAAKILLECNPKGQFHIISALGADASSKVFYNQVKGEVEDALKNLNLEKLVIYRPSLILGNRIQNRPMEQLGQVLARFWDPFLKVIAPGIAGVEASKIAEIMVLKSKKDFQGTAIIESDEIKLLGL